jgi:hypothetical protein
VDGYKRELFLIDWPTDSQGCSLRDDVLAETSAVPIAPDQCHPTTGQWVSSYDGKTFTSASDLEID